MTYRESSKISDCDRFPCDALPHDVKFPAKAVSLLLLSQKEPDWL